MALVKLFLVALVTTAALWTAAEAYVVNEAKTSRPVVELEERPVEEQAVIEVGARPCAPPTDGNWTASYGLMGGLTYSFDMSAVSKTVYSGTGYATAAWYPPPHIPFTLVAQFNETTCVFAGSIIMENSVYSFLWSVISSTSMAGPGVHTINGILHSATVFNFTATYDK